MNCIFNYWIFTGHSDVYNPLDVPHGFTAPFLTSEIAPEPTPQPTHFQIESDLIDLELDVEELTNDPKFITQTIPKHRVLITENDQNINEPHEFNYTDIPDRKNDLSTEATELYRMS